MTAQPLPEPYIVPPLEPTAEALNRAKVRARGRSFQRLKDIYKRDYEAILEEETQTALRELAELEARGEPDARLKPGARKTVEEIADDELVTRKESPLERIREDVGSCQHCIRGHDKHHVCPNCQRSPEFPESRGVPPTKPEARIEAALRRGMSTNQLIGNGEPADLVYQVLRKIKENG